MLIDHSNPESVEAFLATTSKHPRVCHKDVQALLAHVEYFVVVPEGTSTTIASAFLNGFHLGDGHSYCIYPENFNADFGKEAALEKASKEAENAIWKMLGTLLFAYNNAELFKDAYNAKD